MTTFNCVGKLLFRLSDPSIGKRNLSLCMFLLLVLFTFLSNNIYSQDRYSSWESDFKKAFNPFKLDNVKKFFSPDFADEELETWKYNIENGYLKYDSTSIIRLSGNAILLHIPTNDKQYSAKNEDFYFDFIYRIYEISPEKDGYVITKRIMEDFNPDFLKLKGTIEIQPDIATCLIESNITLNLKSNHLIFKLAKEFVIEEFLINEKPAKYEKLGYFIYSKVDNKNRISFSLKGKIKGPDDNNQFISIDSSNAFLRMGGFPVLPSPPPDNRGRYNFSNDSTEFDLTFIFPKEFKHIQYGTVYSESTSNNKTVVSAKSKDEWMDNLSFYSQKDWDVKFITTGNAKLGFYIPKKDSNTVRPLTAFINKLFNWCYSIFRDYPDPKINFIVLNKFVENGALNDNRSILTQNAEIILDDTYIHEILHLVPQPGLKDNFLWIKEGFTNFLSFNYIDYKDNRNIFWVNQKRAYLNAFDQFTEPLGALISTSMPTYWAAYQKGPWVFRMIESIIGTGNFKKAMLQFTGMKRRILANTREYFSIFENISGIDLTWFEDQWIKRKENPSLLIKSSLINGENSRKVNFKISQEGKPFRIPLEIEIITANEKIRRLFWIKSETEEFSFPVTSEPVKINYDPDSELFALIKTGEIRLINKDIINLPSKEITYKFKSAQDNSVSEYRFIPGSSTTTLTCKKGNNASSLELDNFLRPVKFTSNNNLLYTIDNAKGKIHFGETSYDIQEPVFPQDNLLMIYMCVDWSKTNRESFLYLRNNRKRCAVSTAECEKISADEIKLSIDSYSGKIEMFIKNGTPVKYIIDNTDIYELIQ